MRRTGCLALFFQPKGVYYSPVPMPRQNVIIRQFALLLPACGKVRVNGAGGIWPTDRLVRREGGVSAASQDTAPEEPRGYPQPLYHSSRAELVDMAPGKTQLLGTVCP